MTVRRCLAQPSGQCGVRNAVPLQSVDTVLLDVLFRNISSTTEPAAEKTGLSLSGYYMSIVFDIRLQYNCTFITDFVSANSSVVL